MQAIPGEDVKIVEMTTKDSAYYINLVDKTVAAFEKIDSNFKRSPAVGKILSNKHCKLQRNCRERKSSLMQQASFLFYFKTLLQPSQTSASHP